MTVVSGILVAALRQWFEAEQQTTLIATVMFITAFVATVVSVWYTHVLGRESGENFHYAQVVLDVLLATAVVHVTGGPDSNFAPLYILVIGEGALLLPLPGGVLVGGLVSILYFADIFWFHDVDDNAVVYYQIGLFALVALATGFLGDRLRRAGIAVGAVESELMQLRLDTGEILAHIVTGVLTVEGGGRLVYLNAAGEELLGLDARQWVGAPVLDRVEEVAPGLALVLRRVIERQGTVAHFRTLARREEGAFTLEVSTAVLERPEGPPSATAIFQDITDLERIEALDRRNDRLEAVAELSASLAHEIKNPLASIRSAVEQLAGDRIRAEDRGTLEKLVLGETDRLSRLLSEFLEFSGLSMGRSEQIDLAEVARSCVELVRQHPESKGGPEVTCVGLDEPLPLVGDEDLLHRAVFNLVLNAVQFSGPGGDVRIEIGRPGEGDVPPEVKVIPDPVRLSVADTGPGISDQAVGRIFDPFYTTRRGGSGLGLAVVHRAVEVHNGAVLVEDVPDVGARFTIYLPTGLPVAVGSEAEDDPLALEAS